MLNGTLHFLPGALDLSFKRTNTRFQFFDREGIEILFHQHIRGIVPPAGGGFICIHQVQR